MIKVSLNNKQLVYLLMVTGPVYGSQCAVNALQFSQAVLARGHRIHTIFFYQDGVSNANRLTIPANDELDLVQSWCDIAKTYRIHLRVCTAAALRRGITDSSQSLLAGLQGDNFHPAFESSGLGALALALLKCDRFIQF